jgi:flagellar hook-associated protein 1 FlgK
VEVLRLERLRDAFIDANVRQQFGSQADAQAMVEQLSQVEAAFQEPGDNGLSKLFSDFWSTMDAVASNADSPGARQAFAEAANALAEGFNRVAADLQNVADQSNVRLDQTVTEVNDISSRVASLNKEIRNAIEHGQQPNDLLDERDRLMDDLSKLVNFTSTENAFGEVTITFPDTPSVAIVDPATTGGWTAITRANIDSAFTSGGLTRGRAHADEALLNTVIPGFAAQLDSLVASFVGGVNAQHALGFDLSGNAGGAIFDAAGVTAATIRLDPANNIRTNTSLIAAASSWTGASGEPTNGRNFGTMLDTVRRTVQGPPLNATWDNFYTSTVTALGAQSATAQKNLKNADALVELATTRRDQVSGVSMDEEMSNMLRFQNAYNASARVMTAMDELLDQLINRTGRVGL